MTQPNLFYYATSELSQDAFICWLLKWASPECKGIDIHLHKCGIKLIKIFFEKHYKILPDPIEKVVVKKQDSNIDVLCIVNDIYAIIIEDKTRTKQHSGQLGKYLNEITDQDYKKENILPIYFKTYDQSSYATVEANDYKVFLRSDFLSILDLKNESKVKNAIFEDFRSHLHAIEDRVQSYHDKQIPDKENKWKRDTWTGIYMRLQDELGKGNWDYVSNKKGGFMGFWWGFQGDESCKQYLQLEENKLCFKIKVKEKSQRKELRKKWYKILKSKCSEFGINFERPNRFGNGKYMTVMVADKYMIPNDEGRIDVDATVKYLKQAEKLLVSLKEDV